MNKYNYESFLDILYKLEKLERDIKKLREDISEIKEIKQEILKEFDEVKERIFNIMNKYKELDNIKKLVGYLYIEDVK